MNIAIPSAVRPEHQTNTRVVHGDAAMTAARARLLQLISTWARPTAREMRNNQVGTALDDDLWFNPHLGPSFATDDSRTRSHAVISVPLLAVKEYGRKRRLRSKDVDTHFKVLIPVLSNLVVHHLRGSPGDGVPVPLAHKQLGKKGDRYNPLTFPRSFPRMLGALRILGFAEVTKGKYSGLPALSKLTTIKAAPKLVALIEQHKVRLEDFDGHYDGEIIILSRCKRGYGDEGERIDYKDNATTHRFRKPSTSGSIRPTLPSTLLRSTSR